MSVMNNNKELTDEQKQQIMTQMAVNQIMYISQKGCQGIKCRGCVMNAICDRHPSKAKDLAKQLILYSNTL